jgi:signal peptide peptidase SppA
MSEARVIAAILGAEWAITPEALQGILTIAKRENESPEAVEARIGRPLENTHRAEMRGSVAVIPVVGPLFRRANMFTRVSGATSYDMVSQDLREALDNPAAKSIVLNIDSPGGMANGVAELASHIYEARGKKPIVAYVGGTGASAAYWLASSASSIVAAKTAMLGSVGVVVGVGKKGEDEIVSSQSPYKRVDPATAEGRARVQALVDNLAAIFIADVAKYRAVGAEHVSAKFGQGDVMLGQQAAEAGMIDKLGTFEGLIAELNASPTTRPKQEERAVMDYEKLKAEQPELFAQIRAEGVASVNVDAERTAGATTERTRVLGIIGHAEADGRQALALKLAGMPAMSVDGAAEIMGATPKAVVVTATPGAEFEAAMKKNNPTVEADASTGEEAEETAAAARIAALANEQPKRL